MSCSIIQLCHLSHLLQTKFLPKTIIDHCQFDVCNEFGELKRTVVRFFSETVLHLCDRQYSSMSLNPIISALSGLGSSLLLHRFKTKDNVATAASANVLPAAAVYQS